MIRALRADDCPEVADLVAACWAEYPGIVAEDIADERPLLLRFADELADAGGTGFVFEDAGVILGVIGVRPDGPAWEIVRLYLRPERRGGGIADWLLSAAEGFARGRGAASLVLHSDTRFGRAHAFYERHGYARQPATRALGDRSASLEFGYVKSLR